MKIIMLNAATLPVYRDELARLLVEANSQGASAGFPHVMEQKQAEDSFHDLRPALSQNEVLLWIARDEQGVVGTVQLDLAGKTELSHQAEISTLLVFSGETSRCGTQVDASSGKHRSGFALHYAFLRYAVRLRG